MDVTGLAEQHRRKLTRKSRATAIMLALLLVAIIAGCAYGFNYLASNAAYLVAQDGKVAVYQGVPGDIFGLSFNHLDRVTDVALDDLQPGTANRLREEGIKVDSLERADNSLVAEYEKEIADRRPPKRKRPGQRPRPTSLKSPQRVRKVLAAARPVATQGGTDAQGATGRPAKCVAFIGCRLRHDRHEHRQHRRWHERRTAGGTSGGTNR